MIDIGCRYCLDRAELYERLAKSRRRAAALEAAVVALAAAVTYLF